MSIVMVLHSLSLLFAEPSEFSVPNCQQDVESGVWWPDASCAQDEYNLQIRDLEIAQNMLIEKLQMDIGLLKYQEWKSQIQEICYEYKFSRNVDEFGEYYFFECLYSQANFRMRLINELFLELDN